MAMSDEVRSNPRYKQPKKKKEKKGFVESFIPMKGDKPNEIVSKIIVLISILALIVCGIILAVYFYFIRTFFCYNCKLCADITNSFYI